jgi:DNA invertase Pin-like site-specific DNA recombinase
MERGNVRISVGYVQSNGDPAWVEERVDELLAAGCHTVRAESRHGADVVLKPVLSRVCDFLGAGDELVAPDLRHLGQSAEAVIAAIRKVERRGAHVRLLEPAICTREDGGRALIRVIEQLEPEELEARRAKPPVDAQMIQDLSEHGFGPSQIARKLGISRMTVWRKLADVERA